MIYAALVFEYLDIGRALRNLRSLCLPGGILAALLQLPKRERKRFAVAFLDPESI